MRQETYDNWDAALSQFENMTSECNRYEHNGVWGGQAIWGEGDVVYLEHNVYTGRWYITTIHSVTARLITQHSVASGMKLVG